MKSEPWALFSSRVRIFLLIAQTSGYNGKNSISGKFSGSYYSFTYCTYRVNDFSSDNLLVNVRITLCLLILMLSRVFFYINILTRMKDRSLYFDKCVEFM